MTLPARKYGRGYTRPLVPFAWLDRPSGANRFIGGQWIANMLYPNHYEVEHGSVTRKTFPAQS